jgi:hypothetical protein
MTAQDLAIHADLIRRVRERHKAAPVPNPVVLLILEMLEYEYRHAHEIMPIEA